MLSHQLAEQCAFDPHASCFGDTVAMFPENWVPAALSFTELNDIRGLCHMLLREAEKQPFAT